MHTIKTAQQLLRLAASDIGEGLAGYETGVRAQHETTAVALRALADQLGAEKILATTDRYNERYAVQHDAGIVLSLISRLDASISTQVERLPKPSSQAPIKTSTRLKRALVRFLSKRVKAS